FELARLRSAEQSIMGIAIDGGEVGREINRRLTRGGDECFRQSAHRLRSSRTIREPGAVELLIVELQRQRQRRVSRYAAVGNARFQEHIRFLVRGNVRSGKRKRFLALCLDFDSVAEGEGRRNFLRLQRADNENPEEDEAKVQRIKSPTD